MNSLPNDIVDNVLIDDAVINAGLRKTKHSFQFVYTCPLFDVTNMIISHPVTPCTCAH